MTETSATVFDVFEDRTKSILERWKKFESKLEPNPEMSKCCIRGALQEINDDFTKYLMREAYVTDT